MRFGLLVAVVAVGLCACPGAVPSDGSGFFVGFDDDAPKWNGAPAVTPGSQLGAGAFRLTLQWAPGESALTGDDAAGLSQAVPPLPAAGMRIVLSVYGTSGAAAPIDATARVQ